MRFIVFENCLILLVLEGFLLVLFLGHFPHGIGAFSHVDFLIFLGGVLCLFLRYSGALCDLLGFFVWVPAFWGNGGNRSDFWRLDLLPEGSDLFVCHFLQWDIAQPFKLIINQHRVPHITSRSTLQIRAFLLFYQQFLDLQNPILLKRVIFLQSQTTFRWDRFFTKSHRFLLCQLWWFFTFREILILRILFQILSACEKLRFIDDDGLFRTVGYFYWAGFVVFFIRFFLWSFLYFFRIWRGLFELLDDFLEVLELDALFLGFG